MSDLSPSYMTARTALRALNAIVAPLALFQQDTSPSMPTWSAAERERLAAWKRYVEWEQNDPLLLKDEDQTGVKKLNDRISFAYAKAKMHMRFHPEIWYDCSSSDSIKLTLWQVRQCLLGSQCRHA